MHLKNFHPAYIVLLMLVIMACSNMPAADTTIYSNPLPSQSHVRTIDTRNFAGNAGAIIFSLNHIEEYELKNTVDRIIRVFAENEVPVDVAVSLPGNTKAINGLEFLVAYSDAGIVDINLDGSDIQWIDADTNGAENEISSLKMVISKGVSLLKNAFGGRSVACYFPYELFNKYNYTVLQETGFNIISAPESGDFSASRQPVSWSGKIDNKGLFRLPVIAELSYPGTDPFVEAAAKNDDDNSKLLKKIDSGIKASGVAVVSVKPRELLGPDGKLDTAKLSQLSKLVKESSKHGEIVTFNGWYRYASKFIDTSKSSRRIIPLYNGGPSVIFRLDDVSKGWYEDIDKAIIELFQSNGVPLDCGVISNAGGLDSYDLPWLKEYFERGNVGISVHGFDWTYYQLDTVKSGLTYEQIKYKLQKARENYLNYFGAIPVSITAPTDFYDKNGYAAVEDAGFKVFSTQISVEPHPSIVPVDYDGKKDPKGMFRLPTATDVCAWENEKFTGPYDVSKLIKVPDYCRYFRALSTTMTGDNFGFMICSEMEMLNLAVISLHPSAFVENDGKIDQAKLQKVDAIIKWVKTFATVTTFEQWYNYNSIK